MLHHGCEITIGITRFSTDLEVPLITNLWLAPHNPMICSSVTTTTVSHFKLVAHFFMILQSHSDDPAALRYFLCDPGAHDQLALLPLAVFGGSKDLFSDTCTIPFLASRVIHRILPVQRMIQSLCAICRIHSRLLKKIVLIHTTV